MTELDIQKIADKAVETNDWEPVREAIGVLNITKDEIHAYVESGPDGISTLNWSDRKLLRMAEISFITLVPFVLSRRQILVYDQSPSIVEIWDQRGFAKKGI